MKALKRHAGNLNLVGGLLCLDFVNTVDWRGRENPVEFLNEYGDIVRWSRHAGVLKPNEVKQLNQAALKNPLKAETVLNYAISLRETLYRIFTSLFKEKAPKNKDLTMFNEALSQTMAQMKIIRTNSGFSWKSCSPKDNMNKLLVPIVRSAVDLLVSDQSKRIKRCADSGCNWLFLDTSRNRSRRWCDMTDCGNREKASRFYKRKQNTINTSTPRKQPPGISRIENFKI